MTAVRSPIQRLLAPRSVALVGGAWADAVAAASRAIGYAGELWHIHPKRPSTPEKPYYRCVDELPGAPDATFVAAPNVAVPAIARSLVQRESGGFVCFAAGFSETATEQGNRLTGELLESAGHLPFFGPNCYGFVNFFDGAALWPDQVVGKRCERGVALICQSGTIALNLLFNDRSLPIGYVLTVGNQTRLAVEDMIELLAEDDRVTAFGLYVEGIKDAARFARAVEKAHRVGKPIALVKAGRTEAAARTARSHTGALAGADVVFDAYCRQAGIARCDSLATLCETLKVLHLGGPLPGRRVMILGASGGDMAMTADAARDLNLTFPAVPEERFTRLREILTDRVQIANPFDFHTHIWFDRPALRAMFSVVQRSGYDAVGFMIDSPPAAKADPASYVAAIEEFIAAYPGADSRGAVICSLPESLSVEIREMCLAAGVMPLQGQRQALEALDLTAGIGEAWANGASVQLRKPAHSTSSAPHADAGSSTATHGASATPQRTGPASHAEVAPTAATHGSSAASQTNVASAPTPQSTGPAPRANVTSTAATHGPSAASPNTPIRTLPEHEGKHALAAFGIRIPRSDIVPATQAAETAEWLGFPVVIKVASTALEHKSDVGGVIVNIRTRAEAEAAANRLTRLSDTLLVEEMVTGGVAEILIGMTVDPQFGQVMVLGAGGVLTELLRDTVTLLPPFTQTAIESALKRLTVWKLLAGYRGKPPADVPALVETALACGRYAEANVNTLVELDINPVIVCPEGKGAVAVDALIRLAQDN
jgi:acyl-CoA synthetase (NDP forming)